MKKSLQDIFQLPDDAILTKIHFRQSRACAKIKLCFAEFIWITAPPRRLIPK